jgi:hypothetical protein
LRYAFTNKMRHKIRLNISDKYKIMIKLPEVHFGITRSHAEVEHKILIMFSYKIHLDRFSINTKQSILKDLHSNFVQFLA